MLWQLINRLQALTARLRDDERGVTAIEYGLIAALIAVVIIGVVTTVGEELEATFQDVVDGLTGA